MYKLKDFLKPYKKECIVGPLFKLFEAILELILPTIMALIINNGVATKDTEYVFKMGGVMLIMTILGYGSAMICQYYAARASQGFGTNLRNALFRHISSLSYAEIDSFGTSSLVNRLTNDVNQLQVAVAMLIRLVVRAPFICIGAIIMAMILDFKLSLILIATTPFFAVILYLFIGKTSPMYKKYQQKLDKIASLLRENLGGVRVIRAFANISKEKDKFREANEDLTETAIDIGKISSLLNPLTLFVMNVAIIVLLWTGALQIESGRLSAGTIIAFINYMTQVLYALTTVSGLIVIFTKASASGTRIKEIFETTSSINDINKDINNNAKESISAIKFENVSFSYSKTGDMALQNISLEIGKGETIGIIGGTGSGKSTFINLIPRFYDVTEGRILVEGIDVRNYPLKKLRRKISVVPQKTELFTGTIADNLRWGNENASIEEVIEAAKIAQAHEFISKLPKGYDREVARGGANFSGGQKQRLTIARALVKKPEILILDDSSSALDFATDAALRKAIKKVSKELTTIIVSQRASTIKTSDKILVFDDGVLVGTGTHDELMNSCDVYKEICLSQLSNEEAKK
ncbi:ABC transporter ATP-binding protein [Clostridium paraputrificum]|uniref:ABC transporter ATP-binding protein n=1 Tax=Clostridium TaxID=1485 RepID=UPI003D33D6CB